jgi:hypothetical protein
MQTYEKRLCGDLKPQQVNIPPFSAFIGRGDLAHAGDAYNRPESTVSNHVHCTATHDMFANSIFFMSFGNQVKVMLSLKMHLSTRYIF